MASWDDEDYEPAETVNQSSGAADRWSGEDEDDDGLKDNWDDDEEEKEASDVPKSQPKKKKTLAEKIAEREEIKKKEALAKMNQAEEERELTPEEELERKLMDQKRQEEADLELAKEAFGVSDTAPVLPGQKTIDNFNPKNKDEFAELSNMIVEKLSTLEYKTDFNYFLETLVRDCCAGREPEDIKKISNTLTLLANEKQKLSKADKNKGKKKAAATGKKTLATGKGVGKADDDYYDDYYNEYDDFM